MRDPEFAALLACAASNRASDLHVTAGEPPRMRVDGALAAVPGFDEELSQDWVERAAFSLMTEARQREFAERGEVDLAHGVPGIGRLRVNVFRQRRQIAMALRFIPGRVLSLSELDAPDIAREFALGPRGLVLLTGPAGSGKSTTLTAMVDIINSQLPAHIITIEDPVEFRHVGKRALVHQREVGADTRSFAEALRRVLRQDPDVILIGELRDPESIQTALTAAETGHLVLSTLHTQGAAKSINRIVDAFPPDQHQQVRWQLGDTLRGIISQTLVRRAKGGGRTMATEVLVNTPAVANLIREGRVSQLYSVMQMGSDAGMHTLDQDLNRLVAEGVIGRDMARGFAVDPDNLETEPVRRSEHDFEDWPPAADEAPAPRDGGNNSSPGTAQPRGAQSGGRGISERSHPAVSLDGAVADPRGKG